MPNFLCDEPGEQPITRTECTFEEAGWSCNGTGFLWFSDERRQGQLDFPCPRCNTALFLSKAHARAAPKSFRIGCPCCGPGVTQMALRNAVDAARKFGRDFQTGSSAERALPEHPAGDDTNIRSRE